MIYLENKFANGLERDVYLHPNNHNIVVKIRRKNSDWDRNTIESGYYKKLTDKAKSLLPDYHGWIKTNLGHGVVYEAIRNADGSISKTLSSSIRDADISKAKGEKLIRDFFYIAESQALLMYDVSMDNFLLQRAAAGKKLVLVDGYGPRHMCFKSRLRCKSRFFARHQIRKLKSRALSHLNNLF